MTPAVWWRLCLLCQARTRHDGDTCENDPRHPAYALRSPPQVAAFPEHTESARLWCLGPR